MGSVPSARDTEAGGCFCRAAIAASAAGTGEQTELCSFSAPAEWAGGVEWEEEGWAGDGGC